MKISSAQSDFLNVSRWVAAWLVVAEHTRSLVFTDFGGVESPGWVARIFYFLTGFGHEAVVVFFVISGFLVGGKVWALLAGGRFSWKRYLADRTSRLYAVLFVALLLGAAMDWTGLHFFNRYGLYDLSHGQPVAVVVRSVRETLNWEGFLANALFLQTITAPPLGSNGPLWSLANEWWYYLLFPAAGSLIFRGSLARTGLGVLVTMGLLAFLPGEILRLFGVWLLGVGAAVIGGRMADGRGRIADGGERMPNGGGRRVEMLKSGNAEMLKGIFLAVAGVVLVGSLLLARAEVLKTPYVWQYVLGTAYASVLVALAGWEIRFPGAELSTRLADFSYSVYLTHFPILMVCVSAVFTLAGFGIKEPFGWPGLMFFSVLFSAAIFSAWLVSLGTEAKTPELRRRLYGLLKVEGGRDVSKFRR